MILLKRIVLDVLKPHQPTGLDFARVLAEQGVGYRVHYRVSEMDEKTETIVLTVEGDDLNFEAIAEAITSMGASLHSVDEIEVLNQPD